jgi:hypothetical protein
MHIRCDHCGDETLKEETYSEEVDEIVYYFCSIECLEAKDYTVEREDVPAKATRAAL